MISVTILTKDCADTLSATLESVRAFKEVVILDGGSTDATLDIARKFANVKVFMESFAGFGQMHNRACALASYDWILSLDSDEVLTRQAVEEILSLFSDCNNPSSYLSPDFSAGLSAERDGSVNESCRVRAQSLGEKKRSHAQGVFCNRTLALNPACVYAIERHNFFNGRRIKGCGGWHPDWVVRLFNRRSTRFTLDKVHEKVVTEGCAIVRLNHPLLHTPYRTIGDFLTKMQNYSTLFALQNQKKRPVSLFQALLHGWFAFFKSYLLKRGFLDGKEGLVISLYNGHATFYKYLKLSTLAHEEKR